MWIKINEIEMKIDVSTSLASLGLFIVSFWDEMLMINYKIELKSILESEKCEERIQASLFSGRS